MLPIRKRELDIAQASKLVRVAQDAAVISGINSSEAAETFVEAISNGHTALLKQFGLTKNLNDIYNDHDPKIF